MKEDLAVLVKNKYFWLLLLITLLKFTTTGAAMGVAVYFFQYVYGNTALFGVVTMIWFIPPMIANAFLPALTKKIGYRPILTFGFVMQAIGWLIEGYTGNVGIMYVGAFLVGLGGANATLLFPLIGDIVDYGEIKTGKALTGLTNSGYSIGCKVGSGLGGAMVGWILTLVGYEGMAAVQTATAIGGIRFLFGAIPCITSALAALLCWIANVEGELKKARA